MYYTQLRNRQQSDGYRCDIQHDFVCTSFCSVAVATLSGPVTAALMHY